MQKSLELSDEELCSLAASGDRQAEDLLVSRYNRVVRVCARPYFLVGGDSEDLIQEGMIGLFKAVRDYDMEQESSFYSFADLCVSRQLYSAIEASQRKKHFPLNSYISLYEEGDEMSDSKTPLIDTIQSKKESDPEELFLSKEYLNLVESKLEAVLSDMENRVLYLHLLGTDYQTIAKLLDKSPKTIDNALQRIKTKANKIIKRP